MTARSTFTSAAMLVALLGVAASVYAYVSPETGVDDTAGPILTGLGHLAMAIGALLLLVLARGRGILISLFVLAAVLTAFAAFLLQQSLILVPAVAALLLLPLGFLVGEPR